MASRLALAIPLTCLVCFSPPTCLTATTAPHWMTFEWPIGGISRFAPRPAGTAPRSFSACFQWVVSGGSQQALHFGKRDYGVRLWFEGI